MMRALVFFVTFGSFLITVASESIPLSAKLGNFVRFTQAQEEFLGSMRDERERLMADSSARKRLAEGSVNFFEGVFNFRDIGGKRGLGGRIVRTGLIFRSSRFDEITEKGRCRLMNELRLKTDLDLRKDCEVAHLDGCSPLGRDVTWKQIALGAYDEVFSETGRSQMREALATVFCSSNWPLAFHCKTGKDRTGTLAFVLLALLGVEEETICLDWEMSAFHVPELSRMDHPSRYDRLKSCFEAMAGKGFVQKAECYVLSLGFTMAQIQAFRDAMLISPLVIRKINIDAGQTRPFSLLHISDSHVARLDERDGDDIRKFALARAGCGRKSGELFLKAALDLAENFGEIVVHTGDLMEFASAANYDLAASIARRQQFLACVGNHEFWATSKTADEKDKIPFSGLIARIFPGEQPSFVRELNGVNFFFFDNAFGRVSKEVVAAFERVASLSAPMVLVCHVPFPTDELLSDSIVANSLMGEGAAKGDSLTKSFIERVRHERLIKAILCGHLHSFSISRFSPTAVQCVANALFNGECVEVSFGEIVGPATVIFK